MCRRYIFLLLSLSLGFLQACNHPLFFGKKEKDNHAGHFQSPPQPAADEDPSEPVNEEQDRNQLPIKPSPGTAVSQQSTDIKPEPNLPTTTSKDIIASSKPQEDPCDDECESTALEPTPPPVTKPQPIDDQSSATPESIPPEAEEIIGSIPEPDPSEEPDYQPAQLPEPESEPTLSMATETGTNTEDIVASSHYRFIPLPEFKFTDENTPLILDWNRDGRVISLPERFLPFDINADGLEEKIVQISPADAFLALDVNQNGRIDSGKELFGDATVLLASGKNAKDGFSALQQYDENRDGWIDAGDRIFSKLLLWFDRNGNGRSDAAELIKLSQTDVKKLSTRGNSLSKPHYLDASKTSWIGMQSTYVTKKGHFFMLFDVYFKFSQER